MGRDKKKDLAMTKFIHLSLSPSCLKKLETVNVTGGNESSCDEVESSEATPPNDPVDVPPPTDAPSD